MEQWNDIPDYEGLYMVSDAGRVRSADRSAANGIRSFRGKILNPTVNTAGGQDLPNAKLTKQAVLDIRARSGCVTKTLLAHEYGVSRAAIRKIINHQLWRGV